MDLTKNEKGVLLLLLDNSRISDIDMAEMIGITSQAIGLIRKKLEDCIIKKYSCKLDFSDVGFNIFALVMLKDKNNNVDNNVLETLKVVQHIILLCRSSVLNMSIVLYAFRNNEDMNEYFKKFRSQYYNDFDIINFYSCPSSNLIKLDSSQLFKSVLEK